MTVSDSGRPQHNDDDDDNDNDDGFRFQWTTV